MYMLDKGRATLASRKLDQKTDITQMVQFLDKRPEKVLAKELGSIGDSEMFKLVIPKAADFHKGPAIFTVGPTDGSYLYPQLSYSQLSTFQGRRYTVATPKWTMIDKDIYLINLDSEGSSKVRVRGVFDEPWRIIEAKGEFNPLDPWNFEYPLSMKDERTVYELVISHDLGWGDMAAQAISNMIAKSQQDAQDNKK